MVPLSLKLPVHTVQRASGRPVWNGGDLLSRLTRQTASNLN
jgi:hypothetical protein